MDAAAATPSATPSPAPLATPEQRARIAQTAKAFEAQLVSLMLQPMFEGVSTSGPFGGGEAESTYRSFMLDAFGKQMAKAGGIGVAGPVMREMLKMQGLR
jgi:Rod binding domain-containing protein